MKVIPLTIGAWNVHTLMDSSGSDRPERRTALVGRELDRYKVEIAALSETRLAEEGLLKEVGAGYTFFCSGRNKEEWRETGVGFAIKSHLISKLSGLPKGINDRLMTLRLSLPDKRHATIVSACAPTLTNPDEVKDKFYIDLDSVISAASRTDKLILLGDFNARVGTDNQTWEGVIGSEGVGKCNSNGLLLLRKCAEHELLITNTVFRLPTRKKTTWTHPRSKHWHLIDYVIVRRKDRQYVRVTKTMCGADCWIDHRLVVSKLNLRIQPIRRPQGKKVPKKLDVSKLKQDSKRQAFVNDLCSRLDALEHCSEDVDESWTVFRDTVHSSAMDSLGPVSRKHPDWFDENDKEIQGLLEEKHQKKNHKAYLRNTSSVSGKTAYSNICKTAQTRLRDMQDSWLRKKADEIQSFADRKDMNKFFDAFKTVYGPQSSGTTPLLSADGTGLLTYKEAILKKWAEHFDGVLNRSSSINDEAINRLPQVAPNRIWNSESNKTPVIWQGARIRCNTCRALQSRRSSSCRETDSYFTISLLSIAGKILARVLLPIEWTPRTVRASTRKPVWIQEKQRNNRHDLYSTTASRKMPGTECGPLHDFCRPY